MLAWKRPGPLPPTTSFSRQAPAMPTWPARLNSSSPAQGFPNIQLQNLKIPDIRHCFSTSGLHSGGSAAITDLSTRLYEIRHPLIYSAQEKITGNDHKKNPYKKRCSIVNAETILCTISPSCRLAFHCNLVIGLIEDLNGQQRHSISLP